ncbi:ribonuclease HII [Cohnella nanjingensis]|uniref:Ribonuclease HII n=1 Tax=Cohnella nanjingensis TaxID=1387779 RepID=A0A7X0RXG0_9BACL|nr:ribonuclease HII [Cohnella nanjingensis]MBB6675437.1 ribonuclease HII [Cohnella nanjingensis]
MACRIGRLVGQWRKRAKLVHKGGIKVLDEKEPARNAPVENIKAEKQPEEIGAVEKGKAEQSSAKTGRGKKAKDETQAEEIDRLAFERALWAEGAIHIAGVDEVGRGCLFGDVVAAAVILPQGLILDGVDDSKQLSEKKRDALYDLILENAVAWHVGRVDAETIDRINIRQASRLAMKLAVEGLGAVPDHLLVDAESVSLPIPQTAIVKGDARSQSIGAASIVAKVTRDRLCAEMWEALYPGYGIEVHKGYATKTHREALLRMGPTPMHRRSFLNGIFAEQQLLF